MDDVKHSDFDAFRKFFWSTLNKGVYFAPSQYEAGFISLAHASEDIDKTAEVTRDALKEIYC